MIDRQSSELDQKIQSFLHKKSVWNVYGKYIRNHTLTPEQRSALEHNDEDLQYERISWQKAERIQSIWKNL